jgi:hypothetical protein
MSWEDLLLLPEVIKRCAADAKTKASEVIRMVRDHCGLQNRAAFLWMHSFHAAIEAAPDIALTVASAQMVRLEQRAIDERKDMSRRGGQAKNAEHNARADAIRAAWASGKFISRAVCADEEWEGLGFESRDTARDRLKNTPDPDPWSAKQR